MSVLAHGIRLRVSQRWLRRSVELLSSMRFAVTLLTVICMASVIGTVLKQQEPYGNYINQFGPFWADVFATLDLYTLYGSWWFLLILFFLVISTSLCITRHTPQILRDLRNFKENLRIQSFEAFSHKAQGLLPLSHEAAITLVQTRLQTLQGRWRFKTADQAHATLIAAKAGGWHKWGYLAAHSAIVLVCLGGLFDGDLFTKAQLWWGDKRLFTGGGAIADVPASSRLSSHNPAYRANLSVSEGQRANLAVLQLPKGVLLQQLPFSIELKKFAIDYYSTGMPKRFASDIVIHDPALGTTQAARVEVNHPVTYKGISIYQSSFDDGGSRVTLRVLPLGGGASASQIKGVIGESSTLTQGQRQLTLELTALRVLNVESFGKKDLRNIGPSITYKLRDAAGQAKEFQNFMVPVKFDDAKTPVFLMGVRETLDAPFRYWRIPADGNGQMNRFWQLQAALHDGAKVRKAVADYVEAVSQPKTRAALQTSAERIVQLFASGGFEAVSNFIEQKVPADQREKTGEVLARILHGVLEVLAAQTQPSPMPSASDGEWLNLAILALSEASSYPEPLVLTLADFEQVQASVFQVTKAPGQPIVYLGAALLIMGVFLMLYVRERRLWVWIEKGSQPEAVVRIAYSSNRKTLASEREFASLQSTLLHPPGQALVP